MALIRTTSLILVGLAAYIILAQFLARQSLTYQRLGITDTDVNAACSDAWRVPIYVAKGERGTQFNRERGSYDYLKFAVASAEVYSGRKIEVSLVQYADGWENLEKRRPRRQLNYTFLRSELTAEYYFKDESDHLTVLIAFRGTSLLRDWWSNASWITRPLPIFFDHYEDARTIFEEIRGEAVKESGGKPIHYVVSGHSLGGGLAMHIAYGYPCVSAVVFNGSPVTNKFLYKKPFEEAHVVLLYQRCEPLGLVRQIVGGQDTGKGSVVLSAIQRFFGGERLGRNYHDYEYDMFSGTKGDAPGCLERLLPQLPFVNYLPFVDQEKVRTNIFRFHSIENYTQAIARFAVSCEYEVMRGSRKDKCDFDHEFLAARRIYCPYFGSKKYSKGDDDLCTCGNWPVKEQARLSLAGACF